MHTERALPFQNLHHEPSDAYICHYELRWVLPRPKSPDVGGDLSVADEPGPEALVSGLCKK